MPEQFAPTIDDKQGCPQGLFLCAIILDGEVVLEIPCGRFILLLVAVIVGIAVAKQVEGIRPVRRRRLVLLGCWHVLFLEEVLGKAVDVEDAQRVGLELVVLEERESDRVPSGDILENV